MADMRDAMKRAGIVSDKQVRQAKHQKRVHRKEVGHDGLETECQAKEAAYAREQEAKRKADQLRADSEREATEIAQRETSYRTLIKEENLLFREAGPRRFYFVLPDDYVSFVEISPTLAKRLAQGDAAIINAEAITTDGFAVIPAKAAHRLSQLEKSRILLWSGQR